MKPHRRPPYFFLIASALLSFFQLQATDIRIERYTVENGLPDNYISCVVQDAHHYLWIGLRNGLVRYEGNNFKLYTTNEGLSHNAVTALFAPNENELWIGHGNGTLSHQVGNAFQAVKLPYASKSSIIKIRSAGNGGIFYLSKNEGLFEVRDQKVIHRTAHVTDRVFNDFILLTDVCYVATSEGIVSYKIENGTWQPFSEPAFAPLEFSSINNFHWADANKLLYLFTSYEGIYIYEQKSGKVEKQTHGIEKNITEISASLTDRRGNIIVACKPYGLIKILPKEGIVYDLFGSNKTVASLMAETIQSMVEDHEGNIWCGTFGGGLFSILTKPFDSYPISEGNPPVPVNAMLADVHNHLISGTASGIYFGRYDALLNRHQFEKIKLPIELGVVNTLCYDSDSSIFIGTREKGCFRLTKGKQLVPLFAHHPMNDVLHITYDAAREEIWFAVRNNGAHRYHKRLDKWEVYNTSSGFIHNEVNHILVDVKGRAWFSMSANAVAILTDNKFRYLNREDVLPSMDANFLFSDSQGNVWVSTEGWGLFKFDGKENVTRFGVKEGLINEFTYGLSEDANGNIWAMHREGLSKILKAGGVQIYSKKDEVGASQFIPRAIGKDAKGNSWFGKQEELLKHNFSEELLAQGNTDTQLHEVLLLHKPIHQGASKNDQMRFTYHQNQFVFDFSSVSFRKNKVLKYRYKLVGQDEDWSAYSLPTLATYTNLKPGKYALKAQALDAEGHQEKEKQLFAFTIAPPFWQAWWFYVMQIGLFVLMLILAASPGFLRVPESVSRIITLVLVLTVFEFILFWIDLYLSKYTAGVPVFQILTNLILAMLILPAEKAVKKFIKARKVE
jgi:ligand-binding sensor domain-containing protein